MRRPGQRSKYGVRIDKVGKLERTRDGIVFASKKEAKRYGELKLLEKAGEIGFLARQPRYRLHVPNCHAPIGEYVADFLYYADIKTTKPKQVVEDAKGFRTPLYKWKKRHTELEYGILIVEV